MSKKDVFTREFVNITDHSPRPGGHVEGMIDVWVNALPSDAPDHVVEKQAGLFADLWSSLRPAGPPSEWQIQDAERIQQRDMIWWLPRIPEFEDTTHWIPTDASGAVIAYLEEAPAIREIDELMLHALIYGNAVEKIFRLGMSSNTWRRNSISRPPSIRTLSQYVVLTHKDLRPSKGNPELLWAGFSLAWSVAIGALLYPIDWRIGVAAGLMAWHLKMPLSLWYRHDSLPAERATLVESLLHVVQLSRPFQGGSPHSIRQRMYDTENLGADWPPPAYRLVERLIAAGR